MGKRRSAGRTASAGRGVDGRTRRRKHAAGQPPSERLRPWLLGAMTALLVARPLFPSESAAKEGDGLPVVMLWIVLAACWLLWAIGRREFRVRFGWTDAAVLGLIGWHTIVGVWAAGHVSPRPALNVLWEWIGLGLAFLLARQLIVTERETRALIAVMIALAVALSGYGLYQYAYEMRQARAEYAADPDAALRKAGMWFPPGSAQRKLFEDRLHSTEPTATFALTNSLAGYLAPWLVIGVAIAAGTSVGDGTRRRVAIAACLVPVAVCLLLTKSRSAFVATALGLVLVWLLGRGRTWRIGWRLPAGVAIVVAVLLAVAIAVGGLDRQVLSEASKSLGYRGQYWRSTMQMIGDKPLLGCGPGNFQYTYTQYKLPEASEEVADPHNFLLEVWATAGTPAMIALAAVLACFAWGVWRGGVRGQESGVRSQESGVSESVVNSRRLTAGGRAPPTDRPTEKVPWGVYAGATCGFLLAVPLGLLSAAPPGLAAVLLGLPLAAGCIALLAGWVDRGGLPPLLPAVGLSVLLVNLLAAGGIGLPGVAGSLWLLMALGLNLTMEKPRTVPRSVALAVLAMAVTLAVACYTTGYSPVLRSQGSMRQALRDPARAEQHLAAAAAADPFFAKPWQQWAALVFESWQNAPSDEKFRRFETCTATARKLEPNRSRAWLIAGDCYHRAFATTGRREHLDKAIEAYRRAVQLYPNSGSYRAQLALAYRAAGNREAFRKEADEALRLDQLTPHADKKLRDDVRQQLLVENEDY